LLAVFGYFAMLLSSRTGIAFQREMVMMRKHARRIALLALLAGAAGFSTPSRAETGQVAVIFTKGGFIVGVGGGEGVLIFRGHRYPFTVSGMSVGFTIGASTTKFVGRALNLKGPASIEGSYSTVGAGGALAAGAGGVQLQNGNGVILQLSGPKVGAEVSAAVGGVTIRLK
jgi:lipid-binding SYLF domain-containing protein